MARSKPYNAVFVPNIGDRIVELTSNNTLIERVVFHFPDDDVWEVEYKNDRGHIADHEGNRLRMKIKRSVSGSWHKVE